MLQDYRCSKDTGASICLRKWNAPDFQHFNRNIKRKQQRKGKRKREKKKVFFLCMFYTLTFCGKKFSCILSTSIIIGFIAASTDCFHCCYYSFACYILFFSRCFVFLIAAFQPIIIASSWRCKSKKRGKKQFAIFVVFFSLYFGWMCFFLLFLYTKVVQLVRLFCYRYINEYIPLLYIHNHFMHFYKCHH